MSSKSTIFLTRDNEHCFEECNEPHYDGKGIEPENFKGYTICLEIDRKNIDDYYQDEDSIVIYFDNPDSEIYKKILSLKEK